jgi:hypothetical protein
MTEQGWISDDGVEQGWSVAVLCVPFILLRFDSRTLQESLMCLFLFDLLERAELQKGQAFPFPC